MAVVPPKPPPVQYGPQLLPEAVAQYALALTKTLPPGSALSVKPGGQLDLLLQGLAAELAHFEQRVGRFLEEDDPRLAAELLGEWERLVGLPTECVGTLAATSARRAAVVARLRAAGGANPVLIASVMASMGFEDVQIVEYRPADVETADCESPIYGIEWAFAWDLLAHEINPIYFRAGMSTAGEPLTENGNGALECLALELAPAHTFPRARFTLPAAGGYQPWDPADFKAPTLDVTIEAPSPTLAG